MASPSGEEMKLNAISNDIEFILMFSLHAVCMWQTDFNQNWNGIRQYGNDLTEVNHSKQL